MAQQPKEDLIDYAVASSNANFALHMVTLKGLLKGGILSPLEFREAMENAILTYEMKQGGLEPEQARVLLQTQQLLRGFLHAMEKTTLVMQENLPLP